MNRLLRPQSWRSAACLLLPGLCLGASALSGSPLRLDAHPLAAPPPPPSRSRPRHSTALSPQAVRQVSSGSLAGFAAGLVVALFSRALALLGGFLAVSLQLASRWGLDVPRLLHLKQQPWPSLSSLGKAGADKPWFASSFALAFVLAAFVRL